MADIADLRKLLAALLDATETSMSVCYDRSRRDVNASTVDIENQINELFLLVKRESTGLRIRLGYEDPVFDACRRLSAALTVVRSAAFERS